MKHLKKIASLLLAMVMVLTMCVTGYADNTTGHTITVKNAENNHQYIAYQIFSGDKSGNKLINITWSGQVDGTAILAALKKNNAIYKDCSKAEDVAKVLSGEGSDSELVKEFARVVSNNLVANKGVVSTQSTDKDSDGKYSYTMNVAGDGYYFVKDNTDPVDSNVNTGFILKVVDENVEVTPKTSVPTLDKQIKHNEKQESEAWGVVGDNQIGDIVEFRTITSVPDTSSYDTYTYKIYDTMSTELTSQVVKKDNITIKVNDVTELNKDYYDVTVDSENKNKFTVTVDILRAIADGKLTKNDLLYTYYSGILNEKAKVYDKGKQDNTAYLEYSNNPGTDHKGKTPEKKVYDWTFKMEVKKIDGSTKNTINGAKFVLSENPKANYGAVDEHGVPADTSDLIQFIKKTENNTTTYTVAPTNYSAKQGEELTYVIEAGDIIIKGLDDATEYYLYETKAPDGYHALTGPVKFKISAEYNTTGDTCTNVTVSINGNNSNDLIARVENNSGSTLPSTGGIGTTIFYVVGVVLMLGAGVLLITKRRMSAKH